MLIRAFARFYKTHHSYSLVIYGEGGEKQALMRLASSLGVAGAVEFAGQSKTLLSDINDCAMFALSSDYEGMPNVLIEAWLAGSAAWRRTADRRRALADHGRRKRPFNRRWRRGRDEPRALRNCGRSGAYRTAGKQRRADSV
jgi:glycosyltransferase involved in cell wall biosynthesis